MQNLHRHFFLRSASISEWSQHSGGRSAIVDAASPVGAAAVAAAAAAAAHTLPGAKSERQLLNVYRPFYMNFPYYGNLMEAQKSDLFLVKTLKYNAKTSSLF